MLNLKYLRQNLNEVIEKLSLRGGDYTYLEEAVKNDEKRRSLIARVEELKAERNEKSKLIGQYKREGKDVKEILDSVNNYGDEIKNLDQQIKDLDEMIITILLNTPNIPNENIVKGQDENDNKEVAKVGDIPAFDFEPKPHWEIASDLDIIDFERAAKITGSRFAIYKGLGARLERAVINFFVDQNAEAGYEEILPPYIVNRTSMTGTGQLPKFEEDAFKLTSNNDYFLIPTAEVPVTNMYSNEILANELLPLNYTAYSACFRAEAGSAGRDTRGIIRQHQFNKVELVKFVHPENSYEELENLTNQAESLLQKLGLPYRKVELCTGDLGFSAAKTYDLEVWLPSYNNYKEISSCSNFEDFQSRRSNIRFRDSEGKTQFVHTLNGSGLAVGRTVAAIIENYQLSDGTIKVPEVLKGYMGERNYKIGEQYMIIQNDFNINEETKDLVVGVYNNSSDQLLVELNKKFNNAVDFNKESGITMINTLGNYKINNVYFVHLGDENKVCDKTYIKAFSTISSDVNNECLVYLPSFETNKFSQNIVARFTSTVINLKDYKFEKFKSKKIENDNQKYIYSNKDIKDDVELGNILSQATNNCRDLVNLPYNYMNAEKLAKYALELSEETNLDVNIYNKNQIEEMKMGAFLAVNKGSEDEPRLIYIKYQGKKEWKDPIALVGKGVMYDTGGYSIKPKDGMPGMKTDMAGAAAVLGAIEAIARRKLEANVMVVIAATDNRIDGKALVPDDVIYAMNGKSIEVLNTDAEGRLTLADAVLFAQQQGAKKVIDVATLTGGVLTALGTEISGVFTNNKNFLDKFKNVSELTNEKVWELPVQEDYFKNAVRKSFVADLNNSPGRFGHASYAAAFINEFIDEDTEWIHVDIAGTSDTRGPNLLGPQGATGVMVRTLYKFIEEIK